jgi:hypothetical protein
MGLKKGHTNNINGRPLGSINKNSREIKEKIASFINDKFAKIDEEWKELPTKEKFKIIIELLPYILSKSTDEVKDDKSDNDFFQKMQNQFTLKKELDE